MKPADRWTKTTVRLPRWLINRLQREAKSRGISKNALIVEWLTINWDAIHAEGMIIKLRRELD